MAFSSDDSTCAPTSIPTPNEFSRLGNSTGWGNPCGLTGRVTHGWGTGYDSPTRQLSNKPKNVPNG